MSQSCDSGSGSPSPPVENPPEPVALKQVLVQTMDGQDGLYTGTLQPAVLEKLTIGVIAVAPEHAVDPSLDLNHEDRIMRMGIPEWSPAGNRLLLEASAAFDQLQLIVMNADGSNARTASPQTQITAVADWAPDGQKIAYVMSRNFGFTDLGLFTTDLTTDRVTELPIPRQARVDSRIRWNATGTGIYYAIGDVEGNNSDVYFFDVAAETDTVHAATIEGRVRDIRRDGRALLVERSTGPTGPGTVLEVLDLANVQTRLLLATGDSLFGHFLQDPEWVLGIQSSANLQRVHLFQVLENGQIVEQLVPHNDFRIDIFAPTP